MGLIRTLDSQLTNMIAAGEVVERPAGIIKELIDNSIDAKSTGITINVKQGGLELIEVIDNGLGMDASDATMAFTRHATSKIANQEDLWSIKTLGFRGEALPSIASVSKVVLNTSNGSESTQVELAFGKLISGKPYPTNKGTRIKITELFYKTPARLKHLKSPQYEAAIIHDIIVKFALGYPNIRFNYINDGKDSLNTRGAGNLKDTFFDIYGKDIASNTVKIHGEDYDYKLTGLACLPSINRASRNFMNIYINNRMIKYYRLQSAIQEAFIEFMPRDRYPIIALNIEMDEKLVDVNVHPSKWEVRLSKENQLIALVKETINNALKNQNVAPEIKITKSDEVVKYERSSLDLFSDITSKEVKYSISDESANDNINNHIETNQVKEEVKSENIIVNTRIIEEVYDKPKFPSMKVIGQLDQKYVLASSTDGLYIIDQHAAEERVNFEYFSKAFNNELVNLQELLIPINITVSPKIIGQIEEINKELGQIGLHFELFGNQDLLIRAVPSWMIELEAKKFLEDLFDYHASNERFNINQLTKHKLATMACHHSIRFNHALSYEEMESLVNRLASADNPFNCPHGRPTFTLLSYGELERNFKR